MHKMIYFLTGLIVAMSLLLAACQTEPEEIITTVIVEKEPQTIIETVVVTVEASPQTQGQAGQSHEQSSQRNANVNRQVIDLYKSRRDMIGASSQRVAAELGLHGKDPASAVRKTWAWRELRPVLQKHEQSEAGVVGVAFDELVAEQAMGWEND